MPASHKELSQKYLNYVSLNLIAQTWPTDFNKEAAQLAKDVYLEALYRK